MTDEQSLWVDVYDDVTEVETPEGEMNLNLYVIYDEEEQVAKFKLRWSKQLFNNVLGEWCFRHSKDDQPPIWMEKFTTTHVTLCRGRSDAIRQGQAWYKGQVKEARSMLERLADVDKQFNGTGELP